MAFSVGTLGRFFGNTIATAAGFAAGHAAGPVLAPAVQILKNNANALYPHVPPPAGTMAAGVAQGQVPPGQASTWASEQGFNQTAFDAMVNVANTGPALGQAYESLRRGDLTQAEFDTVLQRQAIETPWWPALRKLKDVRLDPTEVAKAVHRGIMVGANLLVTAPPTTPGNVPMVPPSTIDPVTEAGDMGMTPERLRILVGNSGLPPGSGQLMELLNRGHITTDDFQRAVAESNLRNEWGPALEKLAQYVLTPTEYANLHLRGWITAPQMLAGGALHGVTPGDMQLLFEGQGRPLTVHQLNTGLARGGSFNGPTGNIPPAFLTAMQQSSTRPEWFNLDYANRYSYPSAFFFRLLLTQGDITAAEGEQAFLEIGWSPYWAKKIATALAATAAGTKQDAYVTKAQNQLWTAMHKASVKAATSRSVLDPLMATFVPVLADRDAIFQLWADEAAVDAGTSPQPPPGG